MPKYGHAAPFDIIRVIRANQQGLKDLIIQLQQNGISLSVGAAGTNQGPGGAVGGIGGEGISGSGTGLGGNVVFEGTNETSSVPDAIEADTNLTDNQKKALTELHEMYLRSNAQKKNTT